MLEIKAAKEAKNYGYQNPEKNIFPLVSLQPTSNLISYFKNPVYLCTHFYKN